jgi:hypothetical protein
MKTKKIVLTLAAFLVLASTSTRVNAQQERLQTAFIYQLTRLIEWCPQGKEGNFVIVVLGNAPALVTELNALNGRRVGSQQIEVKAISSPAEITKANISSKISGFCTLVVSNSPGSASKGAGVSIVYNDRLSKLEFEINKGFMQSNSLTVNDQLYKLASKVY